MAYSRHISAVKRVEPYLRQLVNSTDTIEFASEDSFRDAYALREGIYASRIRAVNQDGQPNEPYHSYGQLRDKFIFKSLPGRVICQLRDTVPLVRLQQVHNTMVLRDITDELGVVGAAITHGAAKMHFPDADPDDVDLEAVYEWARDNEYFVIVSENGIVLTKTDPGNIAWTPQS